MAAAEVDPTRKDLFLQLSQAEAGHAQLWREKLIAAGGDAERFTPSLRTRVLARLAQRFGPRFVLPAIAARKFADRDKYAGQPDASALSSEERGHATVLQAAATSCTGGMIGADIAKAEPWHRRASGNDLRAAVLGANDGHRSRRVGRKPVECGRILIRLVRAGSIFPGLSVLLRRRHDRNRMELVGECRRLGSHWLCHFAFQRIAMLLELSRAGNNCP